MFDLTDELMMLSNIFHIAGNISLGIAFIILILIGIYTLVYDKTNFFEHHYYYFHKRVKKAFIILFIFILIAIILHIVGAFLKPDISNLPLNIIFLKI